MPRPISPMEMMAIVAKGEAMTIGNGMRTV